MDISDRNSNEKIFSFRSTKFETGNKIETMKYRIFKTDGKIMVEERGFDTFFFWRKWVRWCGSFGNEDVEFESIEDAEQAISRQKYGPNKVILKEVK